jgi:hypothetical protein
MLLVIEIVLFVVGLSLLSSGALPRWVRRRWVRKPCGATVRWLGLLLVLPFPIAFLGGIVLNARLGEQATAFAMVWEAGVLAVAAIAAVLIYRRMRQWGRGLEKEGGGP